MAFGRRDAYPTPQCQHNAARLAPNIKRQLIQQLSSEYGHDMALFLVAGYGNGIFSEVVRCASRLFVFVQTSTSAKEASASRALKTKLSLVLICLLHKHESGLLVSFKRCILQIHLHTSKRHASSKDILVKAILNGGSHNAQPHIEAR